MTDEQLRKSHDEMAAFLMELCHISDHWFITRTSSAEEQYQKARALLVQAGFDYEPEVRS